MYFLSVVWFHQYNKSKWAFAWFKCYSSFNSYNSPLWHKHNIQITLNISARGGFKDTFTTWPSALTKKKLAINLHKRKGKNGQIVLHYTMIMCINPISTFSFSSLSKAFTAPDNVTDIQGGQHASQSPIYSKSKAKRFLERWLSLNQD